MLEDLVGLNVGITNKTALVHAEFY